MGRPRIFDADAGTFHGIARRMDPVEGVRPEGVDRTLDFERLRQCRQQGVMQGEEQPLNAGRVFVRTRNVERQENETRNSRRGRRAQSTRDGLLPVVSSRQKITGGLCERRQ